MGIASLWTEDFELGTGLICAGLPKLKGSLERDPLLLVLQLEANVLDLEVPHTVQMPSSCTCLLRHTRQVHLDEAERLLVVREALRGVSAVVRLLLAADLRLEVTLRTLSPIMSVSSLSEDEQSLIR